MNWSLFEADTNASCTNILHSSIHIIFPHSIQTTRLQSPAWKSCGIQNFQIECWVFVFFSSFGLWTPTVSSYVRSFFQLKWTRCKRGKIHILNSNARTHTYVRQQKYCQERATSERGTASFHRLHLTVVEQSNNFGSAVLRIPAKIKCV